MKDTNIVTSKATQKDCKFTALFREETGGIFLDFFDSNLLGYRMSFDLIVGFWEEIGEILDFLGINLLKNRRNLWLILGLVEDEKSEQRKIWDFRNLRSRRREKGGRRVWRLRLKSRLKWRLILA